MTEFEKYLSDEAVAEFDRIVGEYEKLLRRRRTLRWTAGLAAAVAVIISLVRFFPRESDVEIPISPVVIAEGIGHLMDINSGEVESINAVPQGSKAFVTLRLKNGSECYYLMSYDVESGSTSLVAINNQ
ncbi:MAG: hypothetical protein IJK05_05770 [Bacteroidales bacterium]|nr:hypothetical protein [Bacteroidales bacterium]